MRTIELKEKEVELLCKLLKDKEIKYRKEKETYEDDSFEYDILQMVETELNELHYKLFYSE